MDLDGHIKLDGRGRWARDWVLSEEDLALKLVRHCKENVKALSVESATKFVNTELLVGLTHEQLQGVSIPVAQSTVHSWMRKLQINWKRVHKKDFYTDMHERTDVVEYRVGYCTRMEEREFQQHLWIQLYKTDDDKYREQYPNMAAGYAYTSANGQSMIEHHVDDCEGFIALRSAMKYGGNLSVRFPAGKKIIDHWGQDESVYKLYSEKGGTWCAQGVVGLRKKHQGPGVMISAFQNEKKGFGWRLTEAELKDFNYARFLNKRLKYTPGLTFLKYGKNRDGYWNYEKFKKQTLDFLDLFEHFYPNWQLLLEVDWSAGHGCYEPDALITRDMGLQWGGKQPILRTSTLTEGCLGANRKLQAGDLQYFAFREGDPGPWYAGTSQKFDRYIK